MKKEVKIEIPEGYEIDKENSTFEKIVFKEVKCKYTKELIYPNFINSTSDYYLFFKLVETCKEWNRIDGFVADWSDSNQFKLSVECSNNELRIESWIFTSKPLYFKTKETAELFIETFKEEIEQVKHLI